ncbi:MAG: hypothetical protein KF773_31085 [Deltaproteobacteria bacterium]|nr:hypothetical protein [Deltaproteobacteria bacterium]MCW5808793.1 hypothetical protein [Deltaproteobacteria bacterium]
MRAIATVSILVTLAGCSFVAVRSPVRPPDDGRPIDPRRIRCDDSQLFPTLDALGGAAALAAAGGGILVEGLSDTGKFENFTLYAAGPLVALGVLYFYAASFGTTRVGRCADLKEGAGAVEPIRPIEFDTVKKDSEIEIE